MPLLVAWASAEVMVTGEAMTKAQGQAFAPAIIVFNEAIKASGGFLLQASQQRALGNEGQAMGLERTSNEQLQIANGRIDTLRAVHLGALKPVMPSLMVVVPPLLTATP